MGAALALTLLPAIRPAAAAEGARMPFHPALSADGRQIVYSDYLLPERGVVKPLSKELWVVNADSSGARRLTFGHKDDHPRWSPDGKKIVFVRDSDIWIVSGDGSALKQVTKTPHAIEAAPEWTNDGNGLFFLRDRLNEWDGKWWETGFVAAHHNLATGVDSRLLDVELGVKQIVPDPEKNNSVFVLCNKLDSQGRPPETPEFGVDVIAALDLNSKQLRTIFSLDPQRFKDRPMVKFRPAPGKFLVHIDGGWKDEKVASLENGKLTFLPQFPLFGDINRAGTRATGATINHYTQYEAWGLVMYDLNSQALHLRIETGIIDPARLQAKDFLVRGNALYDQERYTQAIEPFSQAIKLHPQFAGALYNRALCYSLTGDHDRAIADFDAVLLLTPNDGDAHQQRGEARLANGEWKEAASNFTRATVSLKGKEKAAAYRKRAEAYRALGWADMAASDEKRALEIENGP